MILYHTGYEIIKAPDVRRGRRNADLGQGFYLSDDAEFCRRWARTRKDLTVYLNVYSLDTEGLEVLRLERDAAWSGYIYANRTGHADIYPDADVITAPVANDTIYDTLGVTVSGTLTPEQVCSLLLIGPEYHQTAIKTERAANALRFIRADVIDPLETLSYRDTVRREEEAYQKLFFEALERITGDL